MQSEVLAFASSERTQQRAQEAVPAG
eukprot:COSAG05_NODE_11976_length_488_cov_1.092545_1_plen_25_part_10